MSDQRFYSPRVRAEAASLGVDLTKVQGTGAGGRVSLADVRAATTVQPAARLAAAGRNMVRQPLAAAPTRRGPEYALNPLVDEVLRTQPQVASRATLERPTLFATGDVPVFTASGVNPSALLQVPWQARHAVAAASTTGQAFALLEMYAGDPQAAGIEHGATVPNADYAHRVREWARSAQSEDELFAEMFGAVEEAERATARARGLDPRRFDNDAVARRRR